MYKIKSGFQGLMLLALGLTSLSSHAALQLVDDFSTPALDCSNWDFNAGEGGISHDAINNEITLLLKPYTSKAGTFTFRSGDRLKRRPSSPGAGNTALNSHVACGAMVSS